MIYAFRVDSSVEMGLGHVARCLTLANALRAADNECIFICRQLPGCSIGMIMHQGFKVFKLDLESPLSISGILGKKIHIKCARELILLKDAEHTISILQKVPVDVLLVDHYDLDKSWETKLRPYLKKIIVIDDLADKEHDADLLLNQNIGQNGTNYLNKVPSSCKILVGPNYALLRKEFSAAREKSLANKLKLPFKKILISMGGGDANNISTQILNLLKKCKLPEDCEIRVVMGEFAPWLKMVEKVSGEMPYSTSVIVNVKNMAELMAESDFSIGAAGVTSWERCCMGLPTIALAVADNQLNTIAEFEAKKIGLTLKLTGDFDLDCQSLNSKIWELKNNYLNFVMTSANITDGLGSDRVVDEIKSLVIS